MRFKSARTRILSAILLAGRAGPSAMREAGR